MIKPTDTYWELRAGEVAPEIFFNAAYLTPELPLERVSALASALGCGFSRVEAGAGGS